VALFRTYPDSTPDSMELPDHDRIVYIDRQWLPVGELPPLESPQREPKKEFAKSENKQDEREALEKLYRESQSLSTEPTTDEETDFDRLMKWFESHPTLTPTIAELKSVHKFKLRGEIELEDLLNAARQMQILRCHSNGKANRYQWSGEVSLDNLEA